VCDVRQQSRGAGDDAEHSFGDDKQDVERHAQGKGAVEGRRDGNVVFYTRLTPVAPPSRLVGAASRAPQAPLPSLPPAPQAKVINWWPGSVVLSLSPGFLGVGEDERGRKTAAASARADGHRILRRGTGRHRRGVWHGMRGGHILSGWALMSVGMLIFGVATVLGNWTASSLYLIG